MKMSELKLGMVVALAVSACAMGAANDAADVLTLKRVVDLALSKNLDVLTARDERLAARGRMTEATSGALPRLAVNGSYTRFDSMPEGRGDVDTYSAMLGVTQPLYTGGRVGAARRMAKSYEQVVEEGIGTVEQRVIFGVSRAFYNVLLAREDLAVAQDALRLADENASTVHSKYDQGVARKFDLLRAEEQVSQSEADLLRASNAVDIAKTRLYTMIRVEPDQRIPVDGELVFEPQKVNYTDSLNRAMNTRPDLKVLAHELEMQEDAVKIAGAGMRPTVSVTGQAGYMNPNRASEAEWTDAWQAGVVVAVPVFDGLETRGKVSQAKAHLLQSQNQYESLKDRITEEVTQAVLNYRTASERVKAWKKSLAQAEESYRLVTVGYDEGVNQQIDVLAAQLSLTDTRRAFLLSVYEHIISWLALQKAEGTILEPYENMENI